MNSIDFSKIKAKDLPKQKINANLDGTGVKEIEYRSLNTMEIGDFYRVIQNSEDVKRFQHMYELLLSSGLDIPIDIASQIFKSEFAEDAVKVADAVYELTFNYEKAKKEEAETAEKNSVTPA